MNQYTETTTIENMRQEYRRQVIDNYLTQTTLTTDAQVAEFLAAMGTPVLGTKVNCGNPEHTSPFRVVADVITMRVMDFILWANRSGSKTFSVGGFTTFYKSIRYPRYQTKILGGSEAQSTLSYEAMGYFLEISGADEKFLVSPGLTKTKAHFANKSEVSIMPASKKSVRGPHTQALNLDEIDEMDQDILESALSIPQSKHGIPSSTAMYSTNHNVGGVMDKAIQTAVASGVRVYKYCIWECLESCRDFHCSTCKLAPFCPGKHMKEANGYYKLEDLVKKLGNISLDMFQRDWLCIKTGYGDLVYQREFNKDINVVGVSLRAEPVTLSIDWGGVDPFSIGVHQRAPQGDKFPPGSWIRTTELYMTSGDRALTNGHVIKEAKKRPWWKRIERVIYDSSRPDLAAEWEDALPHDVEFIQSDKKSIDDGIECTKSAMCPADGAPLYYVNRICLNWLREVEMYRTKKITDTDFTIIDKNNHAMDDTRYFCKWAFSGEEEGFVGTASHDQMPR